MLEIIDFKERISCKKMYLKYILLVFLLVMSLFYINEKFKYDDYILVNGASFGEKKVVAIIQSNNLILFEKNNELYIKNEKFAYRINSIKKDKIMIDGNYNQEVIIDLDKPVSDEVFELKLITSSEPFINHLLRKLWR